MQSRPLQRRTDWQSLEEGHGETAESADASALSNWRTNVVRRKRTGIEGRAHQDWGWDLRRPHFLLNLFSISLFCASLLITTSHKCEQRSGIDCHCPCRTEDHRQHDVDDTKEEERRRNELREGRYRAYGKDSGIEGDVRDRKMKDRKESAMMLDEKLDEVSNGAMFIDHVVAGNKVYFREALKEDCQYAAVEHMNYREMERQEEAEKKPIGNAATSTVRLFIGITSACCNEKSRKRRKAIRETWMRDAATLDNVEIKFFIGYPDPSAVDMGSMSLLGKEIIAHGDIVAIRGSDVYNNLTNKTLGMMKYMLSSPIGYTHLMKTDDDVYIKVRKLIDVLSDGHDSWNRVYRGRMEITGFVLSRDPASKWHFSFDEISRQTEKEIDGTEYLAGWGYVLSRNLVFHAMKKVYAWDTNQQRAPAWHKRLKGLEDVMTGLLVRDAVDHPQTDAHFKPAHISCTNYTIVVHLDLDAPLMLKALHEMDINGVWDKKTITCHSGDFTENDPNSWLAWRNSQVEDGQKLI